MRKTSIRRSAVSVTAAVSLWLAAAGATAQPRFDSDRWRERAAEDCHYFAHEESLRYIPSGAGALRGAARGAMGGAVFGAMVGGSRGARRGVIAGGALGAVAAGARNQADRDYAYRRAFDECMRDYRR
jgi:hypothetical protein